MLNFWGIMWRPFWKWQPAEIFQCRESISTHISNFDDIGKCWICAVLWLPFWKWRPVEIFRCLESIRDIIIYPHMKCRWNRTMLNLCSIVVAILKMATGRNLSMSGHHYLPAYQILMISDNVEFLRYNVAAILKMATGRNFSMSGINIYPHIKFWWYRTMLNFYRPYFMPCFGGHFEVAYLFL
jgi:hypothetical protein